MKKHLYYVYAFFILQIIMIPFAIPAIWKSLGQLARPFMYLIPCLVTAGIALFSKSRRTFDYLLAAVAPFSLFVFMFLGGFLDDTETCARFDIEHGIRVAMRFWSCYLAVAITAFIASFKPFRLTKFIKGKK